MMNSFLSSCFSFLSFCINKYKTEIAKCSRKHSHVKNEPQMVSLIENGGQEWLIFSRLNTATRIILMPEPKAVYLILSFLTRERNNQTLFCMSCFSFAEYIFGIEIFHPASKRSRRKKYYICSIILLYFSFDYWQCLLKSMFVCSSNNTLVLR